MKAKDIMTKQVASVNSGDSVEKAAQLMKQYDVGSIPVCCEQKVVGIVTDRDITLRLASENKGWKKVEDIMSTNLTVGNPDMDIHDVAKIMSDRQIRRLPIVENNNLVGIVSLGDISVEPSLQPNAEKALKNISKDNNCRM